MNFKQIIIVVLPYSSYKKEAKHCFPYHDFDEQAYENVNKFFFHWNPSVEEKMPFDHYFFLNPLLATTINVSDIVVFDEIENPHNDLVGKRFYPDWLLKDKNLPVYEKWFEYINRGDRTEIGIVKKEIDLTNGIIELRGVYLTSK